MNFVLFIRLADDWAYYASCGLNIGYISPMVVREDVLGVKSTLSYVQGELLSHSGAAAFLPVFPEVH